MNRPMRPGGTGPGMPREGGVHTVKALVVLVVVVLVGFVLLKHNPKTSVSAGATSSHHATTTTTVASSTTTTSTVPPIPPSSIKLQVLNGTGHGSLAGQWTTRLKANPGYQTLPPDDSTSIVATSVIYVITPGYLPEANALATTVGLSPTAVNSIVPAPSSAPIPASERAKANLVLVIGPDLAGRA